MNYEPGFLVDFIDTFLEQQEVDIIVLDGQVSWMIKPIFARLRKFPNARMISCTLAEVTANISTGNMAKNPKFSKFMMDSWKKEECYRYGGIDPRFTNLDYGRDVLLRRRLHSYDAMASRRCHHFSDSQDKIRT